MIKKSARPKNIYEKKQEMYTRYISERTCLADENIYPSEPEARAKADEYIRSEGARWMNIFDSAGELAGFLIVSKKPFCPDHADFCIEHAYIDPACRGQRMMTSRLNEYLEGHSGTFCVGIYKGEEETGRFWDHYFVDTAGYRRTDIKNRDNSDGRIWLAYKPRKKKNTT